jgi:hypothetical protein
MKLQVLPRVENELKKYKKEHQGEGPLYIIVATEESDKLMEEVKAKGNHSQDITVTTYQGSKIVPHEDLKPGEIRLTNELPDTGS